MSFNPKDLLKWHNWVSNAPWIITGAVVGVVAYKLLLEPTVASIEIRSPMQHVHRSLNPGTEPALFGDVHRHMNPASDTPLFGDCVGCTGDIGIASPMERVKFY